MRIVFWGTPDFAVQSLKKLINSRHQVVGVITQPDKPKGRGKKLSPPPVKVVAQEHSIPVFQPEKLKNNRQLLEELKKLEPDIFVVVAYGKIIPEEFINLPKHKTINVHASLLPEYRGAAPIHRALMEGKDKTGVCIMEITKELDAGDVYACKELPISDRDDIISLHDKLAEEGAELLLEVLDGIEKGKAVKKPQEHHKSTYAKPIKKEEGKIDWNRSAREIFNLVRALKVWPKAYTDFRGQQVKILDASVVDENSTGEAGKVVSIKKGEGFVVQTGRGKLLIKKIQFPSGKPISGDEAVRGYHIQEGEKLG
ncbi:MAG: methionyl-tRNA formyltransferase [Aquificae bacterium]|nr:methionyl-tRNA formyltransferase [Aquificota bacterium]